MPIFWRINSNNLDPIFETNHLGFPIENPSYIPDDYLDKKEFIIFRTCHSIGDWGIISAMPRLLKQKYPNLKYEILIITPKEGLEMVHGHYRLMKLDNEVIKNELENI